jgi:transposase-like protein
VITSVQRRRRLSVAEKIRLVEETLEPGMSVSFVARKHSLSLAGSAHVAADQDAIDAVSPPPVRRHPNLAQVYRARSSGCGGTGPIPGCATGRWASCAA